MWECQSTELSAPRYIKQRTIIDDIKEAKLVQKGIFSTAELG